MSFEMKNYKALAAEKKAQQWNKIPSGWRLSSDEFNTTTNVMNVPVTCGLLDEAEVEITSEHDATALLEKLKAGTWTVERVTVAFCKRAAIAHQLTNCLTEIFFDDAIERAKKLDLKFGQRLGKDNLPPLFGLPVSLKDSFQVRGYDTSTGLGCYANEPAAENSALAALLIDLGAVLYCKTNLPQSIMTGDSDNNIFGRTVNPRNKLFTAGGSTGGEGALLALRGSILGIGTDIGGSVRVPSVCNGIYGLRTSTGIIPHGGVRDVTLPGTDGIHSTAGPMATSLRDCNLFVKTMLQAEAWKYDSAVTPTPWLDLKSLEKLRVGVAQNDGVFTPTPPVRRGLNDAINLLRGRDDIEVVPIDLPDVQTIYQDSFSYYTLAGSDHYYEKFARTGEPVITSLESCGLLSVPGTTLTGYFDLNVRRAEIAKTYLHLFRDNILDVILMPPAPHTAVPHDRWAQPAYTCLWNYLDYPALVIPVDKVRDTDSVDDPSNASFSPRDEEIYKLYTGPKEYKDAPICIQLVGYKHRDENLLKAAARLDSIINQA